MKHRLTLAVVLAVLALGSAAACGRSGPEGPTPEELARQDSIRMAEEARQDSIRRAQEQARQDSIAAERERARALTAETESARAILEERIHFGYDQSVLTPESEQSLMRKLAVMRANPDVQIRISGHADERGSIEYNRALGQRRAETAKDFLVGFGISTSRITTVSFGEDRPLVNASNEQAWAQNRRNEFAILSGGNQMRVPSGS